MRSSFYLFLFVFGNMPASAQSSKREADSLYKAKNYAAAAPAYVRAALEAHFKVSSAGNFYDAACSFSMSGQPDSAFTYLSRAIKNGWNNKTHLLKDSDLASLYSKKQWKKLVGSIKQKKTWTNDPLKAQLITSDIDNFWKAYDLAKKDTANRLAIYRQHYVNKGTPGLQDYLASKVKDMGSFIKGHDRRSKFYAGLRYNTLKVETLRPQMVNSFIKFKEVYPAARFPDVYFVMGNFTSGGTVSANGLLIGTDQVVKTSDIPTDELTIWEKNNFQPLENLPHTIAHELIHFNQSALVWDSTLLNAVLYEGMADFFAELISDKTSNERLKAFAKGKEKKIWDDFKREMWLNRAHNWIANSSQETPDHPADLGYWVGYAICKSYYENAIDKKQAIFDILNIKDYKIFYEKSKVDEYFSKFP